VGEGVRLHSVRFPAILRKVPGMMPLLAEGFLAEVTSIN
jgi:hypothetical protein